MTPINRCYLYFLIPNLITMKRFILIIISLWICLNAYSQICNDSCNNDICETATQLTLCQPLAFCNVNCNTENPYPVLPHPTSGVPCDGFVHEEDQWFYIDIPQDGDYIFRIDTINGGFFTSFPQVLNFGPNSGIQWGWMFVEDTLNPCEDKNFILSSSCLNRPPLCFCLSPISFGVCDDPMFEFMCNVPVEFVPFWWDLIPPNFPLDLDPPPNTPPYNGTYDPTRQEWELILPLVEGRYYIMLNSFTPECPSGICPSYGGGNITVCGVNEPLIIDDYINFKATSLVFYDVIEWSTTGELNNEYFILQISKDGTNWEDVTRVNGAGNSSTTIDYSVKNYQFYDEYYYYRLIDVEFDGTRSASEIISTFRPKDDITYTYWDVMGRYITNDYTKLSDWQTYIRKSNNGKVDKIIKRPSY